jgi:hypothetical protein
MRGQKDALRGFESLREGRNQRTSAAKAVHSTGIYGTGEPVPFLEGRVLTQTLISVFPSKSQVECRRSRQSPLWEMRASILRANNSEQGKHVRIQVV